MDKKRSDDWWSKPDHLKDKPKKASAPKSAAKPKSGYKKKKPLLPRVIKHGTIFAVAVVAAAVLSHFALLTFTRHNAQCVVPQLESLSMLDAERVAAKRDLKLVINDSLYASQYEGGIILDQLPEGGAVVKPGRTIYLTVNAKQKRMVEVPYVAERSLRQAKNMLDIAGLTIEKLVYERDLATNYILAQYMGDEQIAAESNLTAPVGSGITLHVGRNGDDESVTPLLLGLSLHGAKSALWEAGLNVGDIMFDDDVDITNQPTARVYSQNREPIKTFRLGGEVSLRLTADKIKADSSVIIYYKKIEDAEKEKLRLEMEADSLRRALESAKIDSLQIKEEVIIE